MILFCRLIIQEMCRLHNAIAVEDPSDRSQWKQLGLHMFDLAPDGFPNDPEKQKRYKTLIKTSTDSKMYVFINLKMQKIFNVSHMIAENLHANQALFVFIEKLLEVLGNTLNLYALMNFFFLV